MPATRRTWDLDGPGTRAAVATIVLVATAVVTLATVPSTALAGERSDTVKIDPGSSASIEVPFDQGANRDLSYVAEVTDGPRIDVFLMDNANHQRYRDGQDFSYHEEGSELDTARAERHLTVPETGTWWIVLDHTSRGEAAPSSVGAEPVTVRWIVQTGLEAGGLLSGWGSAAAITALATAVVAAHVVDRRRGG